MSVRRNIANLVMLTSILAGLLTNPATAQDATAPAEKKRIAAITTIYTDRSHANVILTRLLPEDAPFGMEVASVYTDQVPENDVSRQYAEKYGFTISDTIAGALTLGGNTLAVDGVLLIAEHGKYPKSETGNTEYPKREFFSEIVTVFRRSGRSVPVYIDKHLADNWDDIEWIYETAQQFKIPLMAGSSVPVARRIPPLDTRRDKKLDQIVALSYHTLDGYGFHALEAVQALAERRLGGETGITSVQTLSGDAVWQMMENPAWDADLFDKAIAVLPKRRHPDKTLQEAVKNPTLFILNYDDGLVAYIFTLNGAVAHWTAAWKYSDGESQATAYELQEEPPFYHFGVLDRAIDQMMQTGTPTYSAERTLMTSAALDALLISKLQDGRLTPTPYLKRSYQTEWNWMQPLLEQ